ncbi:MAG: DNA-3-methyladenine glycosylase [Bacteroidales bacterium]|nr:MAG: DNA-3-methyladenine glycosylase [Bacteroidales bacterium]
MTGNREIDRKRIGADFFVRDVLEVAPELPGKILVRRFSDRIVSRHLIKEVEAYRGVEDLACHASKGRTERTEIMFHKGGKIYVYLIYGMYWMLNFVTGEENIPQAVLIRGVEKFDGPGKLTRELKIDNSFYGEDLASSKRIWLEDPDETYDIIRTRRIGIEYAGEYWKNREWRFVLKDNC